MRRSRSTGQTLRSCGPRTRTSHIPACSEPFFRIRRSGRGFILRPVVHTSARVSATAEVMANAVIGENCEIGEGVKIFPNVTVYDGAKVGAGSVLHSGVSVREDCEIGERCVVHNNSTIGSDGFGYAKDEERRWLKIPQVGRVVLEDDVEIGANSAIDRASVGETRIKRGAKIDNLVQIGHSCIVGDDALICSQTGLAGSSVIGKRVILAGQVGIAGHLTVGDDAVLTAKSATSHDVEPGKMISGVPGFDNRDWLRSTAAFRRLGEIARTVRDLEKKVSKLLGE
ncbi:MAG: UDP-3-O-(3-hydroxymyristoyl)glucosamine N-acyltransferase [Acidobacteria bacterium]|nr:UDP-3-O-(3-hydroxymyristoyl)glucosamine N-acyltransferase [Acidobacteriota bacterium]